MHLRRFIVFRKDIPPYYYYYYCYLLLAYYQGQCLWCRHHGSTIVRVHPVHAMNAEQRQMAADLWTKSTGLSHKSACRQHVNCSHHRSPFIITQPESWYSFYRPTENRRLSLPRWPVTYMYIIIIIPSSKLWNLYSCNKINDRCLDSSEGLISTGASSNIII